MTPAAQRKRGQRARARATLDGGDPLDSVSTAGLADLMLPLIAERHARLADALVDLESAEASRCGEGDATATAPILRVLATAQEEAMYREQWEREDRERERLESEPAYWQGVIKMLQDNARAADVHDEERHRTERGESWRDGYKRGRDIGALVGFAVGAVVGIVVTVFGG